MRWIGRPNKSGNRYCLNQTQEQRQRKRDRNSAWKKENRTRLNAYMREWRKKNREHHRRYQREYHQDHPRTEQQKKETNERSSKWYRANKERVNQNVKQYRKRNPGKGAEATARWKAAHPETAAQASRNNARNRRAAKRNGKGRVSVADIERITKQQRGLCAYCRKSLKNGYHVDHIKPLSKGGAHLPHNVQLTCESCNLKKSAHDPVDYARSLGRLI